MADQNGQLRFIPLSHIRENPVALRTVDKKKPAYAELVDSIRKQGILNPISVREVRDPESKDTFYAVLDGLHRYVASLDAGLKDMPCFIRNLADAEVLEAQIIANVHKIETRPFEYAKQLQRIMVQNPVLTASELSAKLGKSPEWLSKILGLIKIKDERVQSLVNEGKINLSNAVALSRLPEEEQNNFVDRAMTQSPAEFVGLANTRVKEIKDAKRKGRSVAPEEFVAIPHMRKMKELKDEREEAKVGPSVIQQMNLTTPLAAWKFAMDWVLEMDPKSIEVKKAEDVKRRAMKEAEKTKKAEERAKQRAEDAAKKAAELATH